MNIKNIIHSIQCGKIRISDHADEESHNDGLTYDEIFNSVFNGEIIEDYGQDKPYPSCLIYGKNFKDEPIHSVWGYNTENEWSVLITVYRPDQERWLNWKQRRRKNDPF